MNIKLVKGKKPQRSHVGWAIQCNTEQEAEAMEEKLEEWIKIGTRHKRIQTKNGKQDILVSVYLGELRQRMFDRVSGKWYVMGKQVTMDELDLLDHKKHIEKSYQVMREWEKEYIAKQNSIAIRKTKK